MHKLRAVALMLFWHTAIMAEVPKTFQMVVSLPKDIIRIGDVLSVDVVTSNSTDHVVYAAEGRGGLALEVLDAQGRDLTAHITGGPKDDGVVAFHSGGRSLRPGTAQKITLHFTPENGQLTPGIYKVRVHRIDAMSSKEVYSNVVSFTVAP